MCEATFVSVSRDASRVAKRDTLLAAVMNNETGVSMWAPHQAIRRTMHFGGHFLGGVWVHGFSRITVYFSTNDSRILTGFWVTDSHGCDFTR